MALLSDSEVEERLAGLSGWERAGEAISKSFKRGDFASSKRYRVPLLGIDYAGKYTAVAPFEYAGP